jgi:hypothetical protein
MARKIIQIAACGVANTASTQCDGYLFALCDDGSVWCQPNNSPLWYSHSVIPDAPIPEAAPSASANMPTTPCSHINHRHDLGSVICADCGVVLEL